METKLASLIEEKVVSSGGVENQKKEILLVALFTLFNN